MNGVGQTYFFRSINVRNLISVIFKKISNIISFFSEMNYEDVFFFNINIAHRLIIIVRFIHRAEIKKNISFCFWFK